MNKNEAKLVALGVVLIFALILMVIGKIGDWFASIGSNWTWAIGGAIIGLIIGIFTGALFWYNRH
jgi:hypothetical protein